MAEFAAVFSSVFGCKSDQPKINYVDAHFMEPKQIIYGT